MILYYRWIIFHCCVWLPAGLTTLKCLSVADLSVVFRASVNSSPGISWPPVYESWGIPPSCSISENSVGGNHSKMAPKWDSNGTMDPQILSFFGIKNHPKWWELQNPGPNQEGQALLKRGWNLRSSKRHNDSSCYSGHSRIQSTKLQSLCGEISDFRGEPMYATM